MNEYYKRMLEWRDINLELGDIVCADCGGSGVKAYGSTALWSGGAGGQAITNGVCDKCWGSGKENSPWFNLRKGKK